MWRFMSMSFPISQVAWMPTMELSYLPGQKYFGQGAVHLPLSHPKDPYRQTAAHLRQPGWTAQTGYVCQCLSQLNRLMAMRLLFPRRRSSIPVSENWSFSRRVGGKFEPREVELGYRRGRQHVPGTGRLAGRGSGRHFGPVHV